jgi:1-acyl-sn-glycerol-3-phosphate acyltransferase
MATSELSGRIRFLRWLVRILLRVLTRFEVHGADKIPAGGPALLTMNHLHWLDPPFGFLIVSRPAVMFAADKWERRPVIGDLLRWTQSTIFVARGEVDRKALSQALEVLKAGRLLAIAPEGTRSKTGALQQGREGPAYLASRTGAVIVPVAAYGQEKAVACWMRLRRPRIVVQIGEPYTLPGTPNKAKSVELVAYTDEIMHRIAELLPPEYRGVYA